jgi:hypothetical protein
MPTAVTETIETLLENSMKVTSTYKPHIGITY